MNSTNFYNNYLIKMMNSQEVRSPTKKINYNSKIKIKNVDDQSEIRF